MARTKEPIKFWDKDHSNYMLLGDSRDMVTRDDLNGTKIVTGAVVAAGDDGNSAKITVNTVDITTQDTPVAGTIDITIKGTDDTTVTVAGNDITIDANPTITSQFSVGMLQGYLLGGMATTAPAKWLVCDGSSKAKATYADLYNYLKTLSEDGATCPYGEDGENFTLPTADNMIIYAGV